MIIKKIKRLFMRQTGSLTLEASLIVPIFLIFIFSLISLIRIAEVEYITQKSINDLALDFCQYSYLGNFTNLDDMKEVLELDSEVLDKLKTQIISFIGDKSYEKSVELLFSKKLSDNTNMKYKNWIESNKIYNVDLSASVMGEDKLFFDLKYNIRPKISLLNTTFKIRQKSVSYNLGLSKGKKPDHENKGDITNDNESIWKDRPITRGKKFIARLRKKGKYINLKKGNFVDFYDKKSNQLIQVNSLNLFDKSYSKNEKDPLKSEDYILDIKAIKKQLLKYKKQLLGVDKNRNFILENGESLNLDNPSYKLLIIVPLEAKTHKSKLEKIRKKLEDSKFILDYIYEEKAL